MSSLALTLSLTLWIAWLAPRVEIRERGILLAGQFFPWRIIESRRWEQEDDARFSILRMEGGGLYRLFPAFAVIIPRDKKDQTSALLDRYLNEWPGR